MNKTRHHKFDMLLIDSKDQQHFIQDIHMNPDESWTSIEHPFMKDGLKAIIPNPSEDAYFLINYDAMTVDWLIQNLHTI